MSKKPKQPTPYQRLRYIFRIASGEIRYASNFGRVCTIERVARGGRLSADLRRDIATQSSRVR